MCPWMSRLGSPVRAQGLWVVPLAIVMVVLLVTVVPDDTTRLLSAGLLQGVRVHRLVKSLVRTHVLDRQ